MNCKTRSYLATHGVYVIKASTTVSDTCSGLSKKTFGPALLLSCLTTRVCRTLRSPCPVDFALLWSQQDLLQDIYTCYEASAEGTPIQVAIVWALTMRTKAEGRDVEKRSYNHQDNDRKNFCLAFAEHFKDFCLHLHSQLNHQLESKFFQRRNQPGQESKASGAYTSTLTRIYVDKGRGHKIVQLKFCSFFFAFYGIWRKSFCFPPLAFWILLLQYQHLWLFYLFVSDFY